MLNNEETLSWFLKFIPYTSLSIIFFFFFGLFSSVLNAFEKFFWASIAPAVWNIAQITMIGYAFIFDLDYIFIGPILLIAAAIQTLITLVPYMNLKIGFKKNTHDKKHKEEATKTLKMFYKNFLPIMFGSSVWQINSLISIALTSYLANGSITVLFRAERLLQVPLAIIIAFNTILLPTLTNEKKAEKTILNISFLLSALVFIPISLAFYFWSFEISELVFHRGKCTIEAVTRIAHILQIFSYGIPAFLLLKILPTFFFAKKQVKYTTRSAIIQTVLNISISLIFMWKYDVDALAFASVISSWANVLYLLFNLKKA
jgi:putative peptidoglycan lipid II flippase